MGRNGSLLFGPLAALIFAAGVGVLPLFVPDYSAMRQTVSEIGEIGSPMRWSFALLLWAVAACVLVFAWGMWRARPAGRGVSAAVAVFCTAWMGVAAAALAWLAHPHPLHNLFGISELFAYQAPLAFAIAWRGDATARAAVVFSIVLYVLTLASVGINLSVIFGDDALWRMVEPVYGLVQRSLFACFFVWCFGVGWLLWSARKHVGSSPAP
jgi:hypothetical protein